MKARKWITEVISLLFALLFTYTALYKFWDFGNFRAVIGQSPLITRFAPLLAVAVPVLEIVISVLLVIPRTRLVGLSASFVLMLFFTAYIGILLTLSIHLPCSCGGVIQQMNWQQHLVFNIFFVLLALVGLKLLHPQVKTSQL